MKQEGKEPMKNTGTLKLTTPGDRELVMARVFDAPRTLVFEGLTRPELLKRWFFGPPERIINTELFDEAWYPGGAVVTLLAAPV
jgi:uncharacterized protein YndB with AHSA1/START domain